MNWKLVTSGGQIRRVEKYVMNEPERSHLRDHRKASLVSLISLSKPGYHIESH